MCIRDSYNPKDGIARTEAELPDLSNNLDDRPVIENGQYIPF